jgi:hypothetical protein
MISRRALAKLAEQKEMPNAFCEMRLPSVLTGLGFSCAKLDFPMVRFRPAVTRADIEANSSLGIFHPVYDDLYYKPTNSSDS